MTSQQPTGRSVSGQRHAGERASATALLNPERGKSRAAWIAGMVSPGPAFDKLGRVLSLADLPLDAEERHRAVLKLLESIRRPAVRTGLSEDWLACGYGGVP